ncbi:Exported protein 10 [Legionella massiliensis]|uniref:Exported protein 10 n=1 Tax=Legionella massiliensis TaxID=1034943 RepID=A0A078L105_9GAMM|nr:competence/damage-inducible protein A [Legionella massiliensis]CDZ77724.1 Exported protein 10 [Legionella massiliensis]CEE13462.1 Putative competence-damage inducible protein [Legionella massiliensis]
MTAGLLATGDEIIHGDTLNTNSHQLAKILSSEGISLGLQLVCSDKERELFDCINFLASNHDLIIITGGLGPTSDDRTRFALARCLNLDLIEFPQAIEHIKNRLKLSDDQLNTGNRQQALFPADATILPNPNGTAVGCYYNWQNKVFVLLPGPPRECIPMFNNYVMPLLQKAVHSEKQLIKWRLFGVAESEIGQKIDEALAGVDCKIGYRLETPYVECKVSCKKPLVETVKQILEPIIAPHIIATPEQKASEYLYEAIAKIQIPISIVDEVTGGILQTLIQHPTSYPWVKFYPYEQAELHFHLRGLKEYWSGEGKTGKTQLSIEYKNNRLSGKESHESHELPFRSPLVVHYAAEWLSFRLFHLINQLHQ